MFTIEAMKSMISNQLDCINGLEKQGTTYTKYVNGLKVNIHITQIHCQIFKDSNHYKNLRINPQKEFKEAEKHCKEIIKEIKEALK
ncbi:hypothetical protein N5J44_14920 [Acinetobacter ursingii]|uniref:hypothetical protein n=1 Tax=Acinetobacter ursingii TaxID=108980 RepID=UPI00244D37D1|nr:hypothetical protein [Acinetobacter ursingii]MDH2020508.1 hypothetical protein [Acinetobacter ursingii]MDH2072816.1 hypothetical protein [Acinetobacter ursingii]